MSLPGWTLPVVTAVIFGLTFLGVFTSIHPIAGFNTKGTAERLIPILEPGDEEPTANRAEDDTPTPELLPASSETAPVESIDMASDPQASEAVEFVLQKPFAEAASLPAPPVQPAANPTSFESPPSENTPALSQDPAQLSAEPYADEMPLPVVPSQSAPSDLLMGTEETFPQYPQPPPEPVTDTGTFLQPPPSDLPADPETPPQPLMSPDETALSSDLPADASPFTEDTVYLE